MKVTKSSMGISLTIFYNTIEDCQKAKKIDNYFKRHGWAECSTGGSDQEVQISYNGDVILKYSDYRKEFRDHNVMKEELRDIQELLDDATDIDDELPYYDSDLINAYNVD